MPETYTGDEGDDALTAGYDVMDGDEDRRDGWRAINKTRDYIAALLTRMNTGTWPWSRISGKPTTYPPSGHTHNRLQAGSLQQLAWKAPPFSEWNTPNNMYVGGYLNVVGAFFNPSTRRIKRDIEPAPQLGGLFPEFKEYARNSTPDVRELGYLAEDLVGTDAERFVKFDQDGQPEAINYLGLLVAQVAELQAWRQKHECCGE